MVEICFICEKSLVDDIVAAERELKTLIFVERDDGKSDFLIDMKTVNVHRVSSAC